jgi:CarD family transcriptional regulator
MFKVGDKVVYPCHGVAVVEEIENKIFSGICKDFYKLRICDTELVIMVPTGNVEKVGLREVIPKKEVPKVMRILKENASKSPRNWNRRQKQYQERLQTGSLFEVAKVFRDLTLLKTEKELSFGEKKVLDNAKNLIVSEIAEAKGITPTKAETMIQKLFG